MRHVVFAGLFAVVLLVVPCTRRVRACANWALAPHSQWQVAASEGVFWLRTPCGERFLSLGVNVINGGYPSRVFNGRLAYHWGTFYPTLEAWAATTRQRLLTWGFNTAGAWSVEPATLPLPFMPDLELGREGGGP